MTEPSYRDFKEWLVANPDNMDQISEIYKKTTIKDLAYGKKELSAISDGKKLRLYELTGLEWFKIEPKIHPNDLDMDKIKSGEQPKSLLSLRIDYDGSSLINISNKFNISKDRLSKYIRDVKQNDQVNLGVERALSRAYSSDGSFENENPIDAQQTTAYDQESNNSNPLLDILETLSSQISGIRTQIGTMSSADRAVSYLDNPNELNLEQRTTTVNAAIDILVDQMEYFRQSNPTERKKLAKSIDGDKWGYVTSILNIIDQPDGFNTFSRLIPSSIIKNKNE